jgi:hypothetical protein
MSFHIIPVAEASVVSLMKSIDRVIINPIIFFLFALATVYFLYGLTQYFLSPDNEEVRKKSKSQMIYGILGLFVMVAVFGILNLILTTIGENKIKIQNNGDYEITFENGKTESFAMSEADRKKFEIESEFSTKTKDLNDPDRGSPNISSDTKSQDKNFDPKKSPFPDYISKTTCWRKVISLSGLTEYEATHPKYQGQEYETVQQYAHKIYLVETGQNTNAAADFNQFSLSGLPINYGLRTYYSLADKRYYTWGDYRAPTKDGTLADCKLDPSFNQSSDNYKYTDEYKESGNVSTPQVAKSTDFSKSPFPEYIPNSSCWRYEMLIKQKTEFKALNDVDVLAREIYLQDGNPDTKGYPIKYGVLVAYNPADQNYYVWVDLRAPIKPAAGAPASTGAVCNLVQKFKLQTPQNQSTKSSSLIGSVSSDSLFYRVVDSGVNPVANEARNIAVKNALIQIANLKQIADTSRIPYRVVPPEKFFPLDPATGNYDYFVIVESPR